MTPKSQTSAPKMPDEQNLADAASHPAWRSVLPYVGLVGVLVMMLLFFGAMSKTFLTLDTMASIANQIPDLILLSVAMTFVLLIGGIDLSVGSLMAFSSAVMAVLVAKYECPISVAVLGCLVTGLLCGITNGAISIGFKIPSFIVTLGMLEIARGGTKQVLDSSTQSIGMSIAWIGEPIDGCGISPAFVLAIIIVVAGQVLLTQTVFGRYCVAIGTNAEAVRMSGIRTAPVCIAVFGLSGLLCGLAGLCYSSLIWSAEPQAGSGMELSAIAACVIGGTSLMGGRGNVICTFLGVLIIAVLQSGLAQIQVTDASKQIVTGAVIIIAVLIDATRRRFAT